MSIRCKSRIMQILVVGTLVLRATDAFEFSVYRSSPGATVEERGDRVPDGRRIIPISATFHLDLAAAPPEMTGLISNAVLEGGNPFELSVRSVTGVQHLDSSFQFTGEYLAGPGSQYLFDWTFTPSTNGEWVWSGTSFWAGGHLWQINISNLILVPEASLTISPIGGQVVEISWPSRHADHVLEQASRLGPADWSAVTNAVVTRGDRLLVLRENSEISQQYFRLRKP